MGNNTEYLKKYSFLEKEIKENIPLEKIIESIISYYENVISCMPGNVYWLDNTGKTVGCNKKVLDMFGFSSMEEFKNLTFEEMGNIVGWSPEATASFKKDTFEVLNTKKEKLNVEEPPIRHRDGRILNFLTHRVPLIDKKGEIVGVVGISIDISDRKRMEKELIQEKDKAEAANKAKSVFIANMSHDIRTPLAGVIGISEILESEGVSNKDRDHAHIIHESSEKLLSLLNDILEIVSAEEIKEESIKNEIFNLRERIEQVDAIFTPNANLKDIQFNIEVEKGVPTYVSSDRIKLDRILLNLISNALKFTEQGEIQLKVSLHSKNDDEALIEFNVMDTGLGIPDDKIHHIFDRFYKVTPSYEGKHAGFGIGLFIVKRYVELLKGTITVTSQLDKGTTFNVILPLKIDKKQAIDTQTQWLNNTKKNQKMGLHVEKTPQANEMNSRHKKVLVIEDDAIASKLAKIALETEGFNAEVVDNAETGLKLVMEKPYDLILTDIGLPKMDGNQFTQLERTWEKVTHHAHLPIVGLSAHSDKEEAKKAGMDLLLTKPLNKQKIEEIKLKFFSGMFEEKEVEENTPERCSTSLGLDLPDTEAKLFELDNYALFDEDQALQSSGGDMSLLKEILAVLADETIPEELTHLEKAHDNQAWEEVRKLAHKLKGGALYCGTIKMQYACQYMERYILAGHHQCCEALYLQLKDVLDLTRLDIQRYLSSEA